MRPSAFRRTALAALVAAVAVSALSPALADPGKRRGPKPKATKPPSDYAPTCTYAYPYDVQRFDLTVNGQPTWGLYAMPKTTPRGIVVFAHGYGHTAESWRKHLGRVADQLGVVTVAMDYRGQYDYPGNPLPTSRGWQVQEGAEDSIAAAQLFERTCPTAKTVVMYGVSMGGNTAGLAVAAGAKRKNGQPLFDYLFDVEGAMNVTETYFEARGLAVSGNKTAVNAVEDIEREMGGPFESQSDTYLERSVVTRVDDIKAAGIKGVVMVHGVDDGLVGYNQSPELYTRLRALGIPVDFWTAVTRGEDSEPGTTLDGYVTSNIPGFESPFAGHASEASESHIVGMAGFERLTALFARNERPACRTGVLDGTLGYTQTKPATSPATC
ncbi:MAG TPA: alpha/beta fold hydrolase [Frankiaceae bacterium]|jgi:acetyl esterase/lipase|nr:alpha/beta fold hydrolase [Frankiaceae bacterium]